MSREWKPGDVAMVGWTVMGEPRSGIRFRAVRDAVGEVWVGVDGSWIGDATAKDVRPLVVIDPEDREAVERLEAAFAEHCGWSVFSAMTRREHLRTTLREFANPKLPIEEPTDPKARVADRRDNIWRLLADGDWVCTDGPDIGEYLAWWQLDSERGPLGVQP